jgi:hypothetical protein
MTGCSCAMLMASRRFIDRATGKTVAHDTKGWREIDLQGELRCPMAGGAVPVFDADGRDLY